MLNLERLAKAYESDSDSQMKYSKIAKLLENQGFRIDEISDRLYASDGLLLVDIKRLEEYKNKYLVTVTDCGNDITFETRCNGISDIQKCIDEQRTYFVL